MSGKVVGSRRKAAEVAKGQAGAPIEPKTKQRCEAEFPAAAKPDEAAAKAKLAMAPSANAAVISHVYTTWVSDLHAGEMMKILIRRTEEMQGGDMKQVEAMLFNQAAALEAIFFSFVRRANAQTRMALVEAYMRMGLKAQNQSRMTLETISTIKNPPAVFARQANINNGGQQQVNNGVASPYSAGDRARAGESANRKTELLGTTDVERLDGGEASAASAVDSRLETVGAVHRPAKR